MGREREREGERDRERERERERERSMTRPLHFMMDVHLLHEGRGLCLALIGQSVTREGHLDAVDGRSLVAAPVSHHDVVAAI